MKTNANRTKTFHTRKIFVQMQIRNYLCSVCMLQRSGKDLCAVYKMSTLFWSSWKFNQRERFYLQKSISGVLFQDEDKMINFDGNNIKLVERFSYLGDVLSTEGGAQKAVTSRIRSAWKKLKRFRMLYAKKEYH